MQFISTLRSKFRPALVSNLGSELAYGQMREHLLRCGSPIPTVLIVGAGDGGIGMQELDGPPIRIIRTDIGLHTHLDAQCDAHALPFADCSLDAVVIQAVLEHVLDPTLCVAEIWRVLRPNGMIFAETPFMQPVHMGSADFTRFTHSGHRYLLREFQEMDSGISGGPGSTFALAGAYLLRSFAATRTTARAMFILGRLIFFPFRLLDARLVNNPAAIDAAASFYFLGKKAESVNVPLNTVDYYSGQF